jgi:hypothetical protein
MDPQLQQIIELQTEQNRLLRKHLWRIRFSLLTQLLLTTAVCCGLGFLVYQLNRPASAPSPLTPPFYPVPPTLSPSGPAVLPESTPKPTIG